MKNESIFVIMQAFYGNRTGVEIEEGDIDFMLQGVMDKTVCGLAFEIDQSIIQIPNSKCVLVYNKYQEADWVEQNKTCPMEDEYLLKPLAFVPERGVEIYSRCFVCRMSEDGRFESLHREDYEVIFNYLSE